MSSARARIYLAGRYSRRIELVGYRDELERRDFPVTSRWLEGDHKMGDQPPTDEAEARKRRNYALEDWDDLRRADAAVVFTEAPRSGSRGGRHVELGAALAWTKPVVVVGPRENVFCHLPAVDVVESWAQALELLELRYPVPKVDDRQPRLLRCQHCGSEGKTPPDTLWICQGCFAVWDATGNPIDPNASPMPTRIGIFLAVARHVAAHGHPCLPSKPAMTRTPA